MKIRNYHNGQKEIVTEYILSMSEIGARLNAIHNYARNKTCKGSMEILEVNEVKHNIVYPVREGIL